MRLTSSGMGATMHLGAWYNSCKLVSLVQLHKYGLVPHMGSEPQLLARTTVLTTVRLFFLSQNCMKLRERVILTSLSIHILMAMCQVHHLKSYLSLA